jgi:hypothetical protein
MTRSSPRFDLNDGMKGDETWLADILKTWQFD